MEKPKAIYKNAWPYKEDRMNLPVASREAAIPFYENTMGFRLISKTDLPVKSAILAKGDIQIGLAENGGDPTQEGCFFEVDNVEAALEELKSNGLDSAVIGPHRHGTVSWRVFYVVAPDGLCYCIGEKES
jgi:catechol 2,3-dioxygenase-like lactoylglutathione lyase family enzyme